MEFKVDGLFENNKVSNKILNIVRNKKILEIGGPSFNNYWIPKFYELSEYTDVINFSNENNISLHTGCGYDDNKIVKIRHFYNIVIDDSYEYLKILQNDYDIILTCHVLEHQANPLKQLLLWKKLLKNDGIFIHVLPEKSVSFDCNRPITDFDKILFKYNNNILENDYSEIDEILKYKNDDATKVGGVTNTDYYLNLKTNTDLILRTQPIHHHVYDFKLLKNISDFLKYKQSLHFNIYVDNWVFWTKR
jgi:SAM-dependent methyltransferase